MLRYTLISKSAECANQQWLVTLFLNKAEMIYWRSLKQNWTWYIILFPNVALHSAFCYLLPEICHP